MQVNFYATFRPIVGGKIVSVPVPDGCTVSGLLNTLVVQFPALKSQLLDDAGGLLSHIHVFVNGRDVPYLPNALETVLTSSDTVDIFPPVGGG